MVTAQTNNLNLFDYLGEIIILLDESFCIKWLNQPALAFYNHPKDLVVKENYMEWCKNNNHLYPSFLDEINHIFDRSSNKEQVTHDDRIIEWELVLLPKNKNLSRGR